MHRQCVTPINVAFDRRHKHTVCRAASANRADAVPVMDETAARMRCLSHAPPTNGCAQGEGSFAGY